MGDASDKEHLVPEKKRIEEGQIIKFDRTMYCHFAVYVGEGKIVHLTADTNDSLDCSSSFALSSGNLKAKAIVKEETLRGKYYIREDKNTDPKPCRPETIIKRAKDHRGEKGYNLFDNNCEHFARWCRFGDWKSKQAENVKDTSREFCCYFPKECIPLKCQVL